MFELMCNVLNYIWSKLEQRTKNKKSDRKREPNTNDLTAVKCKGPSTSTGNVSIFYALFFTVHCVTHFNIACAISTVFEWMC